MVMSAYPPPSPPGMMPRQGALPGGPGPSLGPPSQIIDAEFQLLVSAAESNLAPQPPAWYIPGPQPTADQVVSEATEQKEAHTQRVSAAVHMDLRLGMEVSSIFNADQAWVNLLEIEPQSIMLLRIMHDAIINFVAAQTVQFTSLAQGLVNREERAAIEDHLTDSLADWKGSHFREGQGSLLRTLTADALSGMVAVFHKPDPGNKRSGQRVYRVDPKVVFPVFGRDGLDRVYTVYDATFPEVMRDFGDGPGGPATSAITKVARQGKGRGNHRPDSETSRPLVGMWDREYGVLTWGDEPIHVWHHKLWVVPWHVGVPNWRQSTGAKSSGSVDLGNRSGPLITSNGVSHPYSDLSVPGGRHRDLARMYEPFLTPWVGLQDDLEQVKTRMAYGVDRALDWPLVWKRSSANSGIGTPEPQNYRRGVTEIEEDEELDALPIHPINESFEPWMALMQLEINAAIPVPILQGQTIGTQASGNAIDVINEMGYTHLAPVPEFMQLFLGEYGHRDLTYIKEWNTTYRGSPEGGLAVASRSIGRYNADPKVLTKEMLERAECYVDCTLARFSLAGMAAAATTVSILDQQVHVGTRRYWMERLGMTTNPQQLEDDRSTQDMEDAPGYVEAKQIQHLYQEMERAAAMEDQDSLKYLLPLAKRVAAKQQMHDMAIAKVAGMLPTQPEPMPGELPGNAGQPGANPMPFLSAPEVGRETGTEGGAPTQAPMPLPGQG